MRVPRLKLVAMALLAVLGIVIAASVLAAGGNLPAIFAAPVLLPGFALNVALSGGNIHGIDEGATVFLNIAAWLLLLGVPALVLLRTEP